jgi:NTE family protein
LGTFSRLARSVRAFARGIRRATPAGPPTAAGKSPAIGLALGGGFARGIAHIGVLKVLEEEGIPIRFVAGTSVGALIGAGYCSGLSAGELVDIASRVRMRDFARWTLSRYGLATNERMTQFLDRVLKVHSFEKLRIPLAVAATDFVTGDPVVFRSGPLVDPVRASCAYPGMFLPVRVNGRLLVDGMLAHAVPTVPLRAMGAERVIAVYLSAHWVSPGGPRHVFEVIGQCFSIAQQKMSAEWQAAADFVLQPDVQGFAYDDFEHSAELIRAGETAARAALPSIRAWLRQASGASAPRPGVPSAATHPSPA